MSERRVRTHELRSRLEDLGRVMRESDIPIVSFENWVRMEHLVQDTLEECFRVLDEAGERR